MYEAYLGEGGFVVEVRAGVGVCGDCGELVAVVSEVMVSGVGAWAVTGKGVGARGNGDRRCS